VAVSRGIGSGAELTPARVSVGCCVLSGRPKDVDAAVDSGATGKPIFEIVGDWASGAASNASGGDKDKDTVVATKTSTGTKNVTPRTDAESAADLLSDFPANFEVRSRELKFTPGLQARFDAALELDSESMLVSDFAPDFGLDFDADATARDWFWRCSGAEPETDEASAAPKLVDGSGLLAAEAACFAIEIGSASTCIGVPQVRLHSARQWQNVLACAGQVSCNGRNFRDLGRRDCGGV